MLSRKRILVIDNDEDTCVMLSVFLETDYEVSVASTLAEAVELARRDRFNLYLIDFYLPDGDGLELCQQIRAFDTSTPVIFCSGSSDRLIQQQALNTGAQAFFVKPIDLDDLADAIAQAVNERD